MTFEICAQIEIRTREKTFTEQEQWNEQTADPAIAIEKRMDGLEFRMDNGELHEPAGRGSVNIALPLVHGQRQALCAARDEARLFDRAACRPDPVRNAAVFTRRSVVTTHPLNQHFVRFADQTLRQWQFV